MRRLSTQDQNFKQVFAELLAFETVNDPNLVQTVDQIIADVRQYGDDHVLKLTQQFDRHPAILFLSFMKSTNTISCKLQGFTNLLI